MPESLQLKWGTIKGWDDFTPKSVEIVKSFFADGMCMSAALDRPGNDRKEILCELIDNIDGEIWNDWDGKIMSKDEAKKYVLNYGRSMGKDFPYRDCDCCACRAGRAIGCKPQCDGWHNETGLQRGRPYAGAIINKDGELVIPRK